VPAWHGWAPDMGRSIGTLGRRRAPLDLEFDYFGSTIRVHPQASDAIELDFLDHVHDLEMEDLEKLDADNLSEAEMLEVARKLGRVTAAAYERIMGALRALVHPDDWDTYWRLGKDNRQLIKDRMADIKAITAAVVEADTGFPTGRPSGSPTGPATTPPNSAAVSSSAAAGRPSDADAALVMLRGRPDLQEFVILQEEAEAAHQREKAKEDQDRQKLIDAGLIQD
jgi:hypothetical protein